MGRVGERTGEKGRESESSLEFAMQCTYLAGPKKTAISLVKKDSFVTSLRKYPATVQNSASLNASLIWRIFSRGNLKCNKIRK